MALISYLEAEDDSNGPVPMEVGAMEGSARKATDKKGYGKQKLRQELWKRQTSAKGKERMRDQHPTRDSKATASHAASGGEGEREFARLRPQSGGSSEFFREFRSAECSDHACSCEDGSNYSINQ